MERRGYVTTPDAPQARTGTDDGMSVQVRIDRAVGCQNLEQRLIFCAPGHTGDLLNPESEDVLYVVSGRGRVMIGGASYDVTPGIGILAPPATPYCFENPGPEPLVLVSVISPQPGQPAPPAGDLDVAPLAALTIGESAQEALPAGDRRFKLLVTPRMGCRNVTQFVGFIPPGRAPFHSHTYEEVIYIIDGQGLVHIGSGDFPVQASSSVYLPPLLEHCIENTGAAPLRLLGVFCPAGDPSSKATERLGMD